MSNIDIHLLGRFRVEHTGQNTDVEFDSRKAKELLAFIFLNRDQPHPRESLADLFWKDKSAHRSKKYLRQTLWKIQSVLNPTVIGTEHSILIIEPNWVHINPKADVWFDVIELENTFNEIRGIPGWSLSTRQLETLKHVAELYQGDLVEGFYQHWCLFERERFRFMYLALLDKIISCCQARREFEIGLRYAAIVLRYDRARERTYRRLMCLYYFMGDRTGALRQYESCAKVLEEELGVKPGKQTEKLRVLIQKDEGLDIQASLDGDTITPSASPLGSNEMLNQLAQLNNVLTDMQGKVQEEIRKVQQLTENNL